MGEHPIILAIDPGNTESGWAVYEGGAVLDHGKDTNDDVLTLVWGSSADVLALEKIESYGMAVGASIFETCVWTGRFWQAWLQYGERPVVRVPRRDVKLHLCNSSRAKDPNVRQAIMDRYGSTREKAIGKKKDPGPLYGVAGDAWAALGVAITAAEVHIPQEDFAPAGIQP